MKSLTSLTAFFCLAFFLQSCKFSCSVGNNADEPTGKSVVKDDGARLYNNIKLNTYKIKVTRAYLQYEDGKRVPDDNLVDFTQPVKLMLVIDNGWVERDKRLMLGASETIVAENGTVLLDNEDMFSSYTDGIDPADARTMYLTANIKLVKDAPPTSFSVQFRVWDKNGDGYIEGSYLLFSK